MPEITATAAIQQPGLPQGYWSSGDGWPNWRADMLELDGFAASTPLSVNLLIVHLSAPAAVTAHGLDQPAVVLVPGDSTLIPRGCAATLHHAPRDVLVLELTDALIARAAKALHIHEPASPLLPRCCLRDERITRLCDVLDVEARDGFASGRAFGEAIAMALASRLVTVNAQWAVLPGTRAGYPTARALLPVLEYIDDNLDADLTVAKLARIAGLSRHWFAHQFRAAMHCAPHQYVLGRRIERAKQLLAQTDLSATAVGYALGFGNPSHFAQAFRRSTGVTPSSYRGSHRKAQRASA